MRRRDVCCCVPGTSLCTRLHHRGRIASGRRATSKISAADAGDLVCTWTLSSAVRSEYMTCWKLCRLKKGCRGRRSRGMRGHWAQSTLEAEFTTTVLSSAAALGSGPAAPAVCCPHQYCDRNQLACRKNPTQRSFRDSVH